MPTAAAPRQDFYRRIAPLNMAPLWEQFENLVTPEPKSACRPALWRYADVRPSIMEAGRLITAAEAERRVLILENPGMAGQGRVTTSLYAGLQLVLPGETARAHRHTQSALRFIIEGEGAYTAVDGEKTIMREGDFVITPSWAWHDHGNDSERPMVWLDGLDIPLVQFLDASFAVRYGEERHPLTRPVGDSLARFGAGLLPVDYAPASASSPILNYPYERTRAALEQLRRTAEWDACHGIKLRYVNPANGDFPMPTIGAYMQLLPAGFDSTPYRATDATVFAVVEGRGRTVVGDTSIDWQPRDIFVVPSWRWHRHVTAGDAVLFSFSDRPVQLKLGLWREERGNQGAAR